MGKGEMPAPHGSYLTLGRARWLSWLNFRQSRAFSIREEVVKKCHLLLYFLNLLCMLVEDMFANKFRALGGEESVKTEQAMWVPSFPDPNWKAISLPLAGPMSISFQGLWGPSCDPLLPTFYPTNSLTSQTLNFLPLRGHSHLSLPSSWVFEVTNFSTSCSGSLRPIF